MDINECYIHHPLYIDFSFSCIVFPLTQVEVGPFWQTKIVAYGPGLEGGVVNQPAVFTVETNGETGALGKDTFVCVCVFFFYSFFFKPKFA